jgi:hypothetical protein
MPAEGVALGHLSVPQRPRVVIELVVLRYGIASMMDAPCGAATWIPVVLKNIAERLPCFDYVGADVARPVIAAASAFFRSELPRASFVTWDFATESLPATLGSYELAFCRDALQHLPLQVNAGS